MAHIAPTKNPNPKGLNRKPQSRRGLISNRAKPEKLDCKLTFGADALASSSDSSQVIDYGNPDGKEDQSKEWEGEFFPRCEDSSVRADSCR